MITVWPSLYAPQGGVRVTSRALVVRVRSPRRYPSKDALARWSAANFVDGHRRLANVVDVAALVFDFDDGAPRERLVEAFADYAGFAHTTWSSRPALPRWRVCLWLTRPVNVETFERVWRFGAAAAEAAGLVPDYAARDASRAWAVPARHECDAYEHIELTGAFLDVEEALRAIPKPEPIRVEPGERVDDTYANRLDRASKYLATMPEAVSGSRGHAATFKAAVVLVRGFDLHTDDALRLLAKEYNPRCAPPWSLHELRHKVKSAAKRGRLEPGWLLRRRAA